MQYLEYTCSTWAEPLGAGCDHEVHHSLWEEIQAWPLWLNVLATWTASPKQEKHV